MFAVERVALHFCQLSVSFCLVFSHRFAQANPLFLSSVIEESLFTSGDDSDMKAWLSSTGTSMRPGLQKENTPKHIAI